MSNEELKNNVKFFSKGVLLNTEAQLKWLKEANPDILDAARVFAKTFIEHDEDTSKVDAFQLGFMLGALYETKKGEKDGH
jgi:hypothetical protein